MKRPPVTITLTTEAAIRGVAAALEYGYGDVREVYAPGDGTSSAEQDAVYDAMRELGMHA